MSAAHYSGVTRKHGGSEKGTAIVILLFIILSITGCWIAYRSDVSMNKYNNQNIDSTKIK